MKLYFAPLEGITTYIYRRTHAEMFDGCDEYYAPFISPTENERISIKNLKDIMPENNLVQPKVQALVNNADALLGFMDKIKELGYDEVNLNFGCPSSTVVKKRKGAGFLRDTDELDSFLYEVFEKCKMPVSVKTRTGYFSGDEMDTLIDIYNKYPISLLIVHPRTRMDFYNGEPDMAVFEKTYTMSKNKLCYNGNIFNVSDFKYIAERFEKLDSVMLGRGAVANPALFREIKGGKKLTTAELIEFSERLIDNYYAVLKSDTFTLYKLKEIWMYVMMNFPDEKKIFKGIKKANKLSDFTRTIKLLPEIQ